MNNTQKIKLFDIIFEEFFGVASNQVADGKKITFINFLLLSKANQTAQLKNFLATVKDNLQTTKSNIPANGTAQSDRINTEISLIDSVDAAL